MGDFNVTDANDGNITYQLISGEGFTFDTDGTLRTATTFDYETNASNYFISVLAKDELNATTEGNFTVTLLDVYEPSRENHVSQLGSSIELEMIWVEPGTFTMGSPESEVGRNADETEHNVTLTNGFYLGKYEVTQAQYKAVMDDNDLNLDSTPSYLPTYYPNRPVENVLGIHCSYSWM